VGFGYATKVVGWVCIVLVVWLLERRLLIASVPDGEGSRHCTGTLRALLTLCLCVAFWLQIAELLSHPKISNFEM
jgi:peptidoglycan biosynthesis protein MviN/MurJ (putative lipid II flippase)